MPSRINPDQIHRLLAQVHYKNWPHRNNNPLPPPSSPTNLASPKLLYNPSPIPKISLFFSMIFLLLTVVLPPLLSLPCHSTLAEHPSTLLNPLVDPGSILMPGHVSGEWIDVSPVRLWWTIVLTHADGCSIPDRNKHFRGWRWLAVEMFLFEKGKRNYCPAAEDANGHYCDPRMSPRWEGGRRLAVPWCLPIVGFLLPPLPMGRQYPLCLR
mmetsp:Transcript_26684/g.48363  ORF Transcript_26684/g.48363 Transcript_26684/m.48363 type:complete len:211 (+) Transcript_26684:1642-2274(+)